jgi:hypothetical protein
MQSECMDYKVSFGLEIGTYSPRWPDTTADDERTAAQIALDKLRQEEPNWAKSAKAVILTSGFQGWTVGVDTLDA